jgi:predicted ABC-type transport system involved in lysophospholipase L1 biosynthesis ATPase subunit
MNADLIVARGLRKVYPGRSENDAPTLALEAFDLRVAEHEVACIVGPSGCGKTTLLNLIAGFEKPSEGELTMRGKPVGGPGPERSVVFQQPALFPWLNVWDNVTLGPRMRGVDGDKLAAATEHVLANIGLEGFKLHFPYQLSGRHAPAGADRARAGRQPGRDPDGRTVRFARRADAHHHARGALAAVGGVPAHDLLHHARRRGSADPRRPCVRHVAPARDD